MAVLSFSPETLKLNKKRVKFGFWSLIYASILRFSLYFFGLNHYSRPKLGNNSHIEA